MIIHIIEAVYHFLWGDLVTLHLSGTSIGIPLLVLLLIPTGIYFTFRTNFVSVRLFPDMVRSLTEKKGNGNSLSPLQTLFVSTATRVGMGNLVGVVAAVSAGGAGAVFWMWLSAILGSATAFIEATLAQIHKEEDSLYGGYHGGPAYYIHYYAEKVRGKKLNHSVIAVFFALSGLLCWCGISQVISNSVASAFENAFSVPPIITTVILVILSAIIVLRKNATIKALDIIVPVMAAMYFIITIFIIVTHIGQLPGVFSRIFKEAFGLRAVAGGGFGAVLMNGVKRGLFSNEAGSGSAPCAAAAADEKEPVKMGLIQALGVFIDTIVICTMTALVILCSSGGAAGLCAAHLDGAALAAWSFGAVCGKMGEWLIALAMLVFSFATMIAWFYLGRQTLEAMLEMVETMGRTERIYQWYFYLYSVCIVLGGLTRLEAVWKLSDIWNGLMAFPNLLALLWLQKQVHFPWTASRVRDATGKPEFRFRANGKQRGKP